MAIRTYKVTLDSKNTIAPEPVYLRQGDKTGAVVIDATLMDNGSPVSLDGLTPMFKANTADGKAVIADRTGFTVTDSDNGKFTYQVPNALSAVPGKITTAYFSLSDADGSESTFDVAFIIKKAIDITQAQADDYITIIDGTLNSLQKKIDDMNTDIQTVLNAYNQGDFYNKSETDSKYAKVTAQLADEATQREDADDNESQQRITGLSFKRDKSVLIRGTDLDTTSDKNKIKLVNLSDEVQQALTGGAPALSTIAKDSVTVDALAPELKYSGFNATPKNLFPGDPNKWKKGISQQTNVTGNNLLVIATSKNRLTNKIPIQVISGLTLNVSYFNLVAQIAIMQLDINSNILSDSGWLSSNTSIILSPNTTAISINMRYSSDAVIGLGIVTDIMINIEQSNTAVDKYIQPQDSIDLGTDFIKKSNIDKNYVGKNLFDMNFLHWNKGMPVYSSGSLPGLSTPPNRLSLKPQYLIPVTSGVKISVSIGNSDYNVSFNLLGSDYSLKKDSGWITGTFSYTVAEDVAYMIFCCRRVDNNYITQKSVELMKIKIEIGNSTDFAVPDDLIYKKITQQRINPMFTPQQFRFIAHRGAYQLTGAPEESRKSYVQSCQYPFWGLDADTSQTSDDEFVLMHDATIDRTTNGTGNVSDYTLAELQQITFKSDPTETIPSLEQFLQVCKQYGKVPVIEPKNFTDIEKFIDQIIKSGFEQSIIIQSFSTDTISAIRSLSDKIHLQPLLDPGDWTINFCLELGNASLNSGETAALTKDNIELAHSNGILVFTNSVNDLSTIKDEFLRGVDGTDGDIYYSLDQ